jgi:dihydroorotate dehydrogenase electron transfer subunit
MTKRIDDLKVIDKKRLNHEFCILELSGSDKLPEFLPGQFAQVKVEDSAETFLRRPISIHDVDYEKNSLKLLIQVVGAGSKKLAELENGSDVNLVYPLGNSFSIPENHEKVLLVGGGCGIAPLLFTGRYLKTNGIVPDILLGFRNSSRVIEYDEYLKVGNVYITTEDGSLGEKGFVTTHSILSQNKYDRIYCCGPDPMMKAVAAYCKSRGITCEVSLENLMACGFGVCLCCVVDTVNGNVCTCTDGPIFNIKDLKW